jgi:hypothetical protein
VFDLHFRNLTYTADDLTFRLATMINGSLLFIYYLMYLYIIISTYCIYLMIYLITLSNKLSIDVDVLQGCREYPNLLIGLYLISLFNISIL